MRRIRDHESVPFELRGARVRKARRGYPCDIHGCPHNDNTGTGVAAIERGHPYAYISTGIKVCLAHFNYAEDVVNAE